MNCPVCDSNNVDLKFIKNGFPILHCLNCDHLFTEFKPSAQDISSIYSNDYFFKGGAGYEDYTLEKDMLIRRGEYYATKLKKFMNPGKVLDVGAAAGFILKGFQNKGWEGIGIEPNSTMADYGIQNLGVQIHTGTIESVQLDDRFDLIILIQVEAHIYDLQASMKKIRELLRTDGFVLVETWNKDSLTARVFNHNWHEYSPPGTLNYFSKKSLDYLYYSYGFARVAGGRPQKKILSNHAKSLMKSKLQESRNLKWAIPLISVIPNHIILPYPAEDLFWVLYKKMNV